MKRLLLILSICISAISVAQEDAEKAQLLAMQKANNFVYEGNSLLSDNNFVSAEMEYRKALSKQASTKAGVYNLGTSYIKNGNFDEALYRLQQATSSSTSKEEKHRAFHNIGNILMQNKKCKEAVEAYKNALRNDPTDDETRYNLGLAKECAKQQQDQEDKNQDQDKQDENKENEDKEDKQDQNKEQDENKENEGDNDENKDQKDEGEQDDKKEGDDEKDEDGKPKDEKKDEGDKGEDEKKEQQQPKPQQGQLSPQQIKNLLEAMNNQEQKVQEKINAEKQKGVKIKTEKDW
ncbi:BatC [Tamlana sedimentorum]|uniref:BatC n=2 Tax=Neotamlana sedimentorum TaxID=1435349 RepID=A0A0D7WCH1_9FLAO|nr:BatC [Tamlana sedimentorum]